MGDETKPTPARELRDALAEALWRADGGSRGGWRRVGPVLRDVWLAVADRLLASLPSVKLKMGWEE